MLEPAQPPTLDYARRAKREHPRWDYFVVSALQLLGVAAALVVFSIPRFGGGPGAHVDLTRAQVETGLSGSLDMYKKHMGQYPASLADLLTPPPTEAAEARWRGPYISRECRLRDAWGEPFKYTCPGTQNRDSFDLVSLGADGVAGTADDIGNR